MTLPRLALAVIGDEIGPSRDEMISVCGENVVRRLDMRTVGGRNLMGMSLDEVATVARTLEKAGLSIPSFVSPVLKWAMPGKEAEGGKVDFAFSGGGRNMTKLAWDGQTWRTAPGDAEAAGRYRQQLGDGRAAR